MKKRWKTHAHGTRTLRLEKKHIAMEAMLMVIACLYPAAFFGLSARFLFCGQGAHEKCSYVKMHSCLRLSLLYGLISQIASEFLVDDECSHGECALSVLQVQQRQLSVEDPDQVKTEEVKPEEVKPEEVKTEEVKTEQVKTEQVKTEEVKTEEVKPEEVKPEVKPVEDSANTVSSCSNDTVCGANRTCVFKEDRTWSQCVPLDDKTFQKECKYWDRKMRLAAVAATKILCNSVKCEWDQDA